MCSSRDPLAAGALQSVAVFVGDQNMGLTKMEKRLRSLSCHCFNQTFPLSPSDESELDSSWSISTSEASSMSASESSEEEDAILTLMVHDHFQSLCVL